MDNALAVQESGHGVRLGSEGSVSLQQVVTVIRATSSACGAQYDRHSVRSQRGSATAMARVLCEMRE